MAEIEMTTSIIPNYSGPRVTLYQGDCLDVLAGLETGSVDAVVTDPPYGMKCNTDNTRYSGGIKPSHRVGRGGREWAPIAGDDEPFDPSPWTCFPKVITWGFNHFAARCPVGTTLVWIKKDDHLFGKFLSDGEVAWMKGGHGVYVFRDTSMLSVNKDRVHPNQKPVGLMRWCIRKLKLKPGSTILDPYMGSGTTGVAALAEDCRFIGCEISPIHYATAERRLRAAEAQGWFCFSE